jgi:hypothetical protein
LQLWHAVVFPLPWVVYVLTTHQLVTDSKVHSWSELEQLHNNMKGLLIQLCKVGVIVTRTVVRNIWCCYIEYSPSWQESFFRVKDDSILGDDAFLVASFTELIKIVWPVLCKYSVKKCVVLFTVQRTRTSYCFLGRSRQYFMMI